MREHPTVSTLILGRTVRALWLCALVLATGCATLPAPPGSELFYRQRARRRAMAVARGSEPRWASQRAPLEPEPEHPPVPEDWPERASGDEELLAPFLACATIRDWLALQRTVDMAPVVQRLSAWGAVRLGALGPLVDAQASRALTAQRAAFLVKASQEYGAYAQLFALFIVHTAFDDELQELLRQLARDKQLSQTLGSMEVVRQELERRGLRLADYSERGEKGRDVLRGLGQAARDAFNNIPSSDGARYQRMSAQFQQLPPAYQAAQQQLERELMREHFTPGNVALGSVDQLTFGVPLGFYHLGVGTAHGLGQLWQRNYEQATRELAPAALMVALYAGGKGARYLAKAEGAGAQPSLPEVRLEMLRSVAWQVAERLGVDGLRDLARYIRASREAAVFVGAGGEPAAVALYEAGGDVARAQAWLAETKPERAGAPEPKAAPSGALGGVASLVDEAAGNSAQVVEAKLLQAELEAPGPRLPADVALLNKLHATLSSPPPGVPEGDALWEDYRTYRQRRLAELEQGQTTRGPLRWEAYEQMRGAFARGLAFERAMVELLRADADLPQAKRTWLQGFHQPRVEVHVGVSKQGAPGIRYADVLVIETQPPKGLPPRVETFSFKSRNMRLIEEEGLEAQIRLDAQAALDSYGGTLTFGGGLLPEETSRMKTAVNKVESRVLGVEVQVQ